MDISFYRDGAIENARKVKTALARETIKEKFTVAEVGLINRGEVLEINEPLENGWEERAELQIQVSAIYNDSEILAPIDSVEIDGEYQTIHKRKLYN